jgi:hypothetical protein
MKRSYLLIIMMGICIARVAAQPEVWYPNPAYMYWEEPCTDSFRLLVYPERSRQYFPEWRFDDKPYFINDHLCYVNPFSVGEGEQGKLTIFGVSLCLMPLFYHWDHISSPAPMMDRSIEFDIMLYNFTPGDSNVQLFMSQKFFLDETRSPDLTMLYWSDPQRPESSVIKCPMYEFYFDSPVAVTGDFYAGIHSMDSFCLVTGQLYHTQNLFFEWIGCCHSGYIGFVDMEKTVLRFWDADCYPTSWTGGGFYGFGTPGVLAPQTDTVLTVIGQGIMPITMPEGYLANLSATPLETKSGDVRISPNPARAMVTVEADCDIKGVEVMDMLGRVLISKRYDGDAHSSTLDVSRLSPGGYVVRVKSSHKVVAQKLVVEK